ncbi:MAG: DUF4421 domain-containing protein [Cytophagales bacterium]|mgnify:FL=1|uniref:DUF4421 domain-containing protein n=1 Tax=Cyclobacterium marinum TaxID=104 RepID=UPI0030DC0634|nr:DUF4421 domain-containing protein [Cytophagales bacterium]|tara:strand:- start:15631 stop:16647 length:1017 start_codon:yes stop_codon:yes gene_type:complete
MKYSLAFILLILTLHPPVLAQDTVDSIAYYQTYPDQLVLRTYMSRKYTGLGLRIEDVHYWYRPNSTLNMGVGATFEGLTLNLAYGFGFLNPDKSRGETKYLDLQAHAYPKDWVIDFFGQFYNGYYLERGSSIEIRNDLRIFPGMKLRKLGASVQYLFNGDKFSYRAAFLQNEWQKISSGSFLAGVEMYGGQVRNAEGILPSEANAINFDQIKYFEIGPNLGYAYSWVFKKHFFITLSAATSLALGRTYLNFEDGHNQSNWSVRPNYFLRGFTGYNSDKWSVNVNYVYNQVNLVPVNDYLINLGTGNYRLNVIYRISPRGGLSKKLNWVSRLKNKLIKK